MCNLDIFCFLLMLLPIIQSRSFLFVAKGREVIPITPSTNVTAVVTTVGDPLFYSFKPSGPLSPTSLVLFTVSKSLMHYPPNFLSTYFSKMHADENKRAHSDFCNQCVRSKPSTSRFKDIYYVCSSQFFRRNLRM